MPVNVNGVWYETDAFIESPAHEFDESIAHDRNSGIYRILGSYFLQISWASQKGFSSPPFDFSFGYNYPNGATGNGGQDSGIPTGRINSNHASINVEPYNPTVKITGQVWSGGDVGQPIDTSSNGPYYAYMFNKGASGSVNMAADLLQPGNYVGTLVSSGLSSDAMSFTIGTATFNFSGSTGWSGTGVYNNNKIGGGWNANFNLTFSVYSKISAAMPVMNSSGSFYSFGISQI